MQIEWLQILGTGIACLGAIGSLLFGGRWFLMQRRAIVPKPSTFRSADAGPPPGSVEWVLDITAAMGASHASCVLEALADGCCRDVARARRIEQLEAGKPVQDYLATAAVATVASAQAASNAQLGVKAEVAQ